MEKASRQPTTPVGIGDILSGVLEGLAAEKPNGFQELTAAWEKVAGSEQSEHSEPYAVRGRILFVRVDDSTRAFELSRKYKQPLMRRIQHILGEDQIQDIVFRVGSLSHSHKLHHALKIK